MPRAKRLNDLLRQQIVNAAITASVLGEKPAEPVGVAKRIIDAIRAPKLWLLSQIPEELFVDDGYSSFYATVTRSNGEEEQYYVSLRDAWGIPRRHDEVMEEFYGKDWNQLATRCPDVNKDVAEYLDAKEAWAAEYERIKHTVRGVVYEVKSVKELINLWPDVVKLDVELYVESYDKREREVEDPERLLNMVASLPTFDDNKTETD